ncbi:MAG: hypothetical protein U9N84_15705 [Actinomycetota bacterium]|nr:hypothetical protein [Actinomycetota bacterium]
MEVTALTWTVAITGLILIGLLGSLQLVAVVRPHSEWTIKNVYGGTPDDTDPKAYFAVNQGWAWADVFLWAPLQIAGSIGMLLGHRWGFLLALVASVPFWYTAVPIFIWDRDMAFRQPTVNYWVIIWGIWPVFGIIGGVYCFARLLE